jgi:hypothetical protein
MQTVSGDLCAAHVSDIFLWCGPLGTGEFTMSYFVDRLKVELTGYQTSEVPGHSAHGAVDAVIHSIKRNSKL